MSTYEGQTVGKRALSLSKVLESESGADVPRLNLGRGCTDQAISSSASLRLALSLNTTSQPTYLPSTNDMNSMSLIVCCNVQPRLRPTAAQRKPAARPRNLYIRHKPGTCCCCPPPAKIRVECSGTSFSIHHASGFERPRLMRGSDRHRQVL